MVEVFLVSKIAIIQHDDAIRNMYKFKFESHKFTVKTARCGKSGLEIIKDFIPDVVLMDIHLPFISGPEVVEYIRKISGLQNSKILLTANYDEEAVKKHFEHIGVDGYILKAEHTPTQILDIVRSIIGKQYENSFSRR